MQVFSVTASLIKTATGSAIKNSHIFRYWILYDLEDQSQCVSCSRPRRFTIVDAMLTVRRRFRASR